MYEELCTLARLNGGKVYPSYDRLASATALGRALQILEDTGFLIRQRRFRCVEGAGPCWEQTSNAYRPVTPKRILSLLPRWLRPAPVPDDALQHVADEGKEQERLKAQLSCRELAQFIVGGPMGHVLACLGAAIDNQSLRRESHSHPESYPDSLNHEVVV
ncbi:hypothetical protein [Sphingomonas fuzhouensis]|uniref:hypothetical protein n=1 Tax=Sphingomonas fuzhouensis TaxID=3106033 RepID=UPI002AFE37CF|nr:hypothetical protein [Sphingomonas sp. SGZ-02]